MKREEVVAALEAAQKKGYNIWSNPKRNSNGNTYGDECEYCLRKCGKNPFHVLVTTDGTIVPIAITEKDLESAGIQNQGCWPIGIGCAKKLLKADIEKYAFRYK